MNYLHVNGSFSSLLDTWSTCEIIADEMQFIYLYFALFLVEKILLIILLYLVLFQKVIDNVVKYF